MTTRSSPTASQARRHQAKQAGRGGPREAEAREVEVGEAEVREVEVGEAEA